MNDPRFPDHRGLATWGDRLVPLEDFVHETLRHGRQLSAAQRRRVVAGYREPLDDPTPVEGPYSRIVVFGGVYSNTPALEALIAAAQVAGAEALYCLGDLGGFGPSPEQVWPLIERSGIRCIQGNYEQALSGGLDDCNCGYTDPRDNHYAGLSYRYTAERCSARYTAWMGRLPLRRRVRVGAQELLLVHGSPRRINEFLFDSTTSSPFLEALLERHACDAMLCTHSGLHWRRRLDSGREAVNVGVIGRPANDGRTEVWYALLDGSGPRLQVELLPLAYDHMSFARRMRDEGLPAPFVETIESGWWTTCLEILPARERAAARY